MEKQPPNFTLIGKTEPNPLTPNVDFAFHGKSGGILPELAKAVFEN